MQNDITKKDEQLRQIIIERVLIGIFIIGIIQSIATIFAHKSNLSTLWVIISLVPIIGIAYLYVKKTGRVMLVCRCLIYIALPVLILRAYSMGGVWGVTTNWLYLIPVFGALFLGQKRDCFFSRIKYCHACWSGHGP